MHPAKFDPNASKLTVAQLRQFLETMHPEMRVLIPGYEGGLEDAIPRVKIIKIGSEYDNLFGPHNYAESGESAVVLEARDYDELSAEKAT